MIIFVKLSYRLRMNVDLQDVQEYGLEILKKLDEICDRMGVKYVISSGTLLGAIRHNGFIPWDDDVDVIMLREEYEKFVNGCSEYLPEGWFMQTFHSDHNYPVSFGKLRNGNIKLTVKEVSEIEMGIGACIDIFPIDKCSNCRLVDIWDRFELSILTFIKYSILDEGIEKQGFRKIFRNIARSYVKKNGTYRLNVREEHVRRRRNNSKNMYTYADFIVPAYKLKWKNRVKWEDFLKISERQFNDCKVKAMVEYDDYLSKIYGDYMKLPPVEQRKPAHNFIIVED